MELLNKEEVIAAHKKSDGNFHRFFYVLQNMDHPHLE